MSVDIELTLCLQRIEKLLGYLRGNENAWDYLTSVTDAVDQASADNVHSGVADSTVTLDLEEGYHFPCPDIEYAVRPLWRPVLDFQWSSGFDATAFVKEVQAQADLAWQQGVAWAQGIGSYADSICAQFMLPDPTSLEATLIAMQQDVVLKLQDSPVDDWANLGLLNGQWTGKGATSFNIFYQNFNEAIARYGLYSNLVCVGFACVTRLIAGTQAGALKFVQSFEKILQENAAAWAEQCRPPQNPPELPAWVADVKKIGLDALAVGGDFIPVVGDFVSDLASANSKANHLKTLVTDVGDVTGIDLPELPNKITILTAEQGYDQLVSTLSDDYRQKYLDALDQLDAGTTPTGGIDPSKLTEQSFSGSGVLGLLQDARHSGTWQVPDVGRGSLRGDDPY